MSDASVELSRMVILCGQLARAHGMRVGVYGEGPHQYLQIDLPTGAVRFPLHDNDPDWTIFGPDMDMVNDFDGREDRKWDRIWDFIRRPIHVDQYVVASFRASMHNLERQLVLARDQRAESGRMFRIQRAAKHRLEMTLQAFWQAAHDDRKIDLEPLLALWEKAKKLVDLQIRESESKEDPSR